MSAERPILFSAPMVRAILAGEKTQTRRVVKPQPSEARPPQVWVRGCRAWNGAMWKVLQSPFGEVGDRLWVRETWRHADWTEDGKPFVRYAADGVVRFCQGAGEGETLVDRWAELSVPSNYAIDGKSADRKWRPSIFMPRWASRITLEITNVRVQRLQEIGRADAKAEGFHSNTGSGLPLSRGRMFGNAELAFQDTWDSLNAKRAPWSSNPWVWALTFRKVS